MHIAIGGADASGESVLVDGAIEILAIGKGRVRKIGRSQIRTLLPGAVPDEVRNAGAIRA